MKSTAPLIIAVLLVALPPLESFGRIVDRQGSGSGGAARNPVTQSRLDRPAQQPAVQRPATQRPSVQRPPAQRPTVQQPATQRPSVQRPPARPVERPSARPVERPGNRPVARPETRPQVRPETRPQVRPETRPQVRPETRPQVRPEARPPIRPETRPQVRPEARPPIRPETRPSIRPIERPTTLPGNVTFPRPSDRPNLSRPGGATTLPEFNTRPGGGITRPGGGLNRPGGSTRPDFDFNNRPERRPEWGNWGNLNRPGNRPNFSNNNINVNIRNNASWSYRPNYWGSRPWWGSHHHHWHHGSWCYGWGRSHRRSFTHGFIWGVTAWSMGNWIFNSGYQNFHNPFPAPPVINQAGTTIINYTQPITVAAAEFPPGDEASELAASKKAESAMEEALAAFRKGKFDLSLTAVDAAISAVPGDPATHEFRALVFFAMGRYNDAAGVLNPILASGPGWDWTTMTGLFESQDEYTKLLRKLEEHHKVNPDSAAANFLLGYHYLVLGHLEQALELFAHSAKLEPTDTVSAGLRDLIRDSINEEGTEGDGSEDAEPPAPVNPDKLVGNWISEVAGDGIITLAMTKEGNFTWSFDKTGNSGKLTGEFGIYDPNLLVLISEDSQMTGEITFTDDSKLSFVLAGGPRGDPGLTFVRKP